jgi:hypothetical protein
MKKPKPHPKYSETLIAHACWKAYNALRAHYGADPNDFNDPRGVERAIRRDVIAVLDGATARTLHNDWANRKLGGVCAMVEMSSVELKRRTKENPTLGPWSSIPDHDKAGYRLFCRTVHEARREHEEAGFCAVNNAKFPREFKLQAVDKLDSFLAAEQKKLAPVGKPIAEYMSHGYRVSVYPGTVEDLRRAIQAQRYPETTLEQARLEDCGRAADQAVSAYAKALGLHDGVKSEGANVEAVKQALRTRYAGTVYATLNPKSNWLAVVPAIRSLYLIFVQAALGAADRFDRLQITKR